MITIVTGNPRSGTSMTMKILNDAGIPAIYNSNINSTLNPYGSFETNVHLVDFTQADGKCIKVLGAAQLFNLPAGQYKVILPVRDPEQVVLSRIEAFKNKTVPSQDGINKQAEQVRKAYNFIRFVAQHRPDIEILEIPFDEYYTKTQKTVDTIATFVGVPFDKVKAKEAVDLDYYKIRTREEVLALSLNNYEKEVLPVEEVLNNDNLVDGQ